MKIERPSATPLTPEELIHLETLKSVVEKALDDGRFSTAEVAHIKSVLWSNGKVTYEELRTVHETIRAVMGDTPPGLEWIGSLSARKSHK